MKFTLPLAALLPLASSYETLNCTSNDFEASSLVAINNMLELTSSDKLPQQFNESYLGLTVMVSGETPGGGGGMNPDGVYWGSIIDADYLPADACDGIVGGAWTPQCEDAFDPDPSDPFYPIMNVFNTHNVTHGTYQVMLSQTDVQVWYGCSMPSVKYFGFDTIIGTRAYDNASPPDTPDGKPVESWHPGINFADPVNSVNTGKGTYADSSPMAVIYASDSSSASSAKRLLAELLPADDIHVVQLDMDVFRPVVGDASTFSGWKDSKPDNLRHLIRSSIPDPSNKAPYEAYAKSYFPFFHLTGNEDRATEDTRYYPESKPRETENVEMLEVKER